MLAYAFRALSLEEYEDLAAEDFDRMHDLLAAILAKGISRQLKQGLHREYRSQVEDLATVRGRIELHGTIGNRMRRSQRISCQHDELSENNLFNQALKSTSMVLLRHGEVGERYRSELRRAMLFFSGVDEIEPSEIRWSAMRFQRGNASYRFLMGVCRLVLDGMLLTTDEGERRLARFVDDQRMSRLFEKFILEYYAAECQLVRASAPQIRWALDDGLGAMLPTMQSDVVLSRGNDVLIIDAKYYSHTTQEKGGYGARKLHSGNLYQIFTYVKNKEAELADVPHRVSGMLLYAKTDEEVQPNNSYQMSGNRISVRTLDLNRPFSEIRAQLDGIAESYFSGSAPAV